MQHENKEKMKRVLYCTGCNKEVEARLTDGSEIYSHRPDLHELPFWKCDDCGNFVGCHHKTKNRTQPLGCIPTPQIKNARKHLHKIIDPLWESKKHKRKEIYAAITKHIGWDYHTAKIRNLEEARAVYKFIKGKYYAKK